MKTSESYDLGLLVGEIIEDRYLLTMSTDMLKTKNVVEVTDETDLKEFHRLEKILDNTYKINGGDGVSKDAHKEWITHVYKLADKYLPKTIECKVTKINPKNMEEFKEGLRGYLWDTDLSWYMPEDGFFPPSHKYSHYSTIILTRTNN